MPSAESTSDEPTGSISLQTIPMPADTNWNGDVFGGWLVSQMDLAGGVVARRRAQGRIATVAIDAMVFHHPVKVGDVLSCYTVLERVGKTSMRVVVVVWETSDPGRKPKKVTEGQFTYVAIDDAGAARAVPAAEAPG